eukprot:9985109-Alexandrium_andersonii.AAC.1
MISLRVGVVGELERCQASDNHICECAPSSTADLDECQARIKTHRMANRMDAKTDIRTRLAAYAAYA